MFSLGQTVRGQRAKKRNPAEAGYQELVVYLRGYFLAGGTAGTARVAGVAFVAGPLFVGVALVAGTAGTALVAAAPAANVAVTNSTAVRVDSSLLILSSYLVVVKIPQKPDSKKHADYGKTQYIQLPPSALTFEVLIFPTQP